MSPRTVGAPSTRSPSRYSRQANDVSLPPPGKASRPSMRTVGEPAIPARAASSGVATSVSETLTVTAA